MDITSLFKACVKTVRLRNNSINPSASTLDKNRILQKPQKNVVRHEFNIKTQDICHQLTQLKQLLLDNRSAYMRFGYHLKSAAQMSDEQRDIIDKESENILSICTQFVADLRQDYQTNNKVSKQMAEHMNGVLELLTDYLKAVYNIYNQQKSYRIKHELDTYKLLKLESNKKSIPIKPAMNRVKPILSELNGGLENDNDDDDDDGEIIKKTKIVQTSTTSTSDMIRRRHNKKEKQQNNSMGESNSDDENDFAGRRIRNDSSGNIRIDDTEYNLKKTTNNNLFNQRNVAAVDDDARKWAMEQDEISAEDIQMFESENHLLFNELKGLSDEVEQIGRSVVDIANLQEIFTEKVALQKTDIERIANTVVGATENVKDANEEIKKAIQRNAGLRVYILFFLLVMSFSLLFLDWYND